LIVLIGYVIIVILQKYVLSIDIKINLRMKVKIKPSNSFSFFSGVLLLKNKNLSIESLLDTNKNIFYLLLKEKRKEE
jgi:hypothetical protein